MKKFQSGFTKLCTGISYVSLVALLFAMIITVIDIIMKLTIHQRVLGNMELVELSMVIMMFLSFPKTQLEGGNVRVDMFVNKFPPKVRCAINGVIQCIVTIFSFLLMKQAFRQIGVNHAAGTSSQILHIPYSPFSVILTIGFALLTVAMAFSAVQQFVELPNAKPIEQ